jgi:hypothetical protein
VSTISTFNKRVRDELGWYVYLYTDPESGRVFYVGKGKGNRCFAHLRSKGDADKARVISRLRKLELSPRIDILRGGLSQSEAFLVESAVIEALGIDSLSNRVRGHGAVQWGRDEVSEVAARLGAKPAKIVDPSILIKVTFGFRPDMTIPQMYDATRGCWKTGAKRSKAKYAMCVYGNVIREVFEISGWLPAGATMKAKHLDGRPKREKGRWEFVGRVADEAVRRRYRGKSVESWFGWGAQNPIRYVAC